MDGSLLSEETQLRVILDAIPSMVVIVDRKMRILDANRAAIEELGRGENIFLKRLCGEVLRCRNVLGPGRCCGESEDCEPCLIRQANRTAINGGSILRQHQRMQIGDAAGGFRAVDYFITANPFRYQKSTFVLMVLDDVTELMRLRRMAGQDENRTRHETPILGD